MGPDAGGDGAILHTRRESRIGLPASPRRGGWAAASSEKEPETAGDDALRTMRRTRNGLAGEAPYIASIPPMWQEYARPVPRSGAMRPVLIAHSDPDDFRDTFASRFPDVEFVYNAKGICK